MLLFKTPKIQKGRRTAKEIAALEHLNSFIDGNLEEPIRILNGFWGDQQKALTYQEIREIVKYEQAPEQLLKAWQQDYSNLVKNKFAPVWISAMMAGAAGMPGSGNYPSSVSRPFNPVSLSVANWINNRGAAFVTAVTQEQKDAIKGLLAKKIVEQHTTEELAKLIRPCIGLTKRQAEANRRYYESIKETLKKEHPRMRKETIEKKARDAAAKYAERQHRYRAQMIADTEMAFAYNRGQEEWVRQMQQAGLMGAMERRWITAGDSRVCQVCSGLNGIQVAMDKEFDIPGRVLFPGMHETPPAHTKCRCAVQYIETDNIHSAQLISRPDCVKIDNRISEKNQSILSAELALMPEAHRNLLREELKEIRQSESNSYMDRREGVMYLDSNLERGEFIHEAAHLIEYNMGLYHDAEFIAILRAGLEDFSWIDIEYVPDEYSKIIFVAKNPKFISEYQGRLYEEVGIFDELDQINPYSLAEYFSEGYREYIFNPENLKAHDVRLYNFIARMGV